MGTYRVEWDCCGSVTETEAWEPESCPFCTDATPPAAPLPEPVAWQFRWTNPRNKPDVRPHKLEWREVVQTNSMHTIADAVADLRGYSFDGKPCYEVRALYASPPAAPAPASPTDMAHYDAIAANYRAAPVVREPLTDEQINDIWNAKYLPEHRSHLSPWGMDRIRAIIAAANGIGGGGNG